MEVPFEDIGVSIGQYFEAVFGHEEGVFPLGRRFFVIGDDCPPVVFVDEHMPVAHVDHGFDGEDHTRDEQHAGAFTSEVEHFRLFVERKPHAMSAEVAHDREAVFLGMPLYGVADVADKTERLGGAHAYFEALFGDTHELFFFGGGLSYDEHALRS